MSENKTDIDEVLERAKKRLKRLVDLMAKTHEIGKRCMEFIGGEQWEETDIKSREATNRPMITINKLASFVNTVVNKNSQEKARIKAIPFEDSDTDNAKVINGLIKHIQYSEKSDAGKAYSKAFFDLVTMGFGYWRVDTEYCDDMSVTEQEIVINLIEDALAIFLDPDGNYGFEVKFIPKEEFEESHKDVDISGDWGITELTGNDPDDVMVVEYWEKSSEDITIHSIELPDLPETMVGVDDDNSIDSAINGDVGQVERQPKTIVVTDEELKEYPEDITVLASRKSKKTIVKQYLFAGNELLESADWAGKYIPIVGIYGRKFKMRDDTFFLKPLCFDAIDSQKYYNFLKSQDFELMMMAPKNTWVGVAGVFDGHEDEYSNSNTSHVPYVEYNPKDVNGDPAPPPRREAPPQPNQAFYNNMMQASDEIKATIGMYDASLGATSNETSGRAILARTKQGDVSTHHYTAAANAGLRQTGLIIVDLRPHIYDTARTIRILGDDLADEVVRINQPYVDQKTGKVVNYDMTSGKYDIKIETGASSATRRMDAAENLLEFARVVPNAGELSSDLIAGQLDFDHADEMSLRLKAALPNGLLDKVKQLEDGDNGGPTPEQLQMQKMVQLIQKISGDLEQTKTAAQGLAKENQALKKKMDDGKLLIEQIKAQAGIKEEVIKANAGIKEKEIEAVADVQVAKIENCLPNNTIPPAVAPAGGRQFNMAMNSNYGGRR